MWILGLVKINIKIIVGLGGYEKVNGTRMTQIKQIYTDMIFLKY